MRKSVINDTYLAKWISGELHDSELRKLISKNDFDSYMLLKERISGMQSISLDIETTFQQLKQKKPLNISFARKTNRTLKIFYSSVAVLLFFITTISYHFGVFGAKNISTVNHSAKHAIGKNVSLFIYQNTSITQSAPLYNTNEIELKYGEVYFEVNKGQNFKIKTSEGFVEVLGTKFNVKSNDNVLHVKCFEGRVKVTHNGLEHIVDSGKEFNSKEEKVQQLKEGSSSNTDSEMLYHEFESINLVDVKAFLEKTYTVKVTFPADMLYQKFSGTLPKNDLELSLRLIASSFHLNYEISHGHVIFKT